MDETDLGILYFLDIDSRCPVTDIAKRIGEKNEKINYRVNRLLEEGTIRRCYAEVNPWRIGYTSFKVYLQFQGVDEHMIEEMYQFLSSECNVNWIASCLGRWDMIIDILARDRHEFNAIYMKFHRKYCRQILNKVIGVTLEFSFTNKKWLCPQRKEISSSMMRGHPKSETDHKDMKILSHLILRGRDPVRKIAQVLNMPQTTVSQRINAMVKKGVISHFRTDIDLGRFDRVFCKSFVFFSTAPAEEEKKLFDYCLKHKDIIFFCRIIGPWEMEIDAHSRSFNEFTDMMNDLRDRFPKVIRNFEAVVINKGTGSFQALPQDMHP